MGTYLTQTFGASGVDLALAYENQSIGALIAPFIVGLIADRFFAAQKLFGVFHLFGGVLLIFAPNQNSFLIFYPLYCRT